METKKVMKLEDILKVDFTPTLKGYSPLEVDVCLDSIYDFSYRLTLEKKNLLDQIENLTSQIKVLSTQKSALEIENASLKTRLEDLPAGDNINNIDYLTRIRRLEMALYNAGIDPEKI